MLTLQTYDPARTPRDWMDIVQPTQVAVFASIVDGGDPCDVDGVPAGDAPTCTIFDSLTDAEAFCLARVQRLPHVRFDVFDAAGRSRPPLRVVVHPSRASTLDGHTGGSRVHRWLAVALILSAPVLFWIDWGYADGLWMVPTLVGFNALLLAARLLQMDYAHSSAERSRRERHAGPVASDNARKV
jgi:hypothetical protein